MSAVASLLSQSIKQHQSGNLAGAATGYAQVLNAQPHNSQAWHLAGVLAHQMGRSADAIQQIQFAIELESDNAEYFCNLATVLCSVGEFQLGLKVADDAIAIDKKFAQAHYQKGKLLINLNRFDEAKRAFEESLKVGGDNDTTTIEIVHLLQAQGESDEAISILQSMALRSPENPQSFIELAKFATSGKYQFTPDEVSQIRILSEKANNMSDRARLQHALAVHAQHEENSSKAFELFTSANSWMVENYRQRTSKTTVSRDELADVMKHLFGKEVSQGQSQHNGNDSDLPVFIIGMPRSGTTLLQQLLVNHSQVAGLGELTAISNLFAFDFKPNSQGRWASVESNWQSESSREYLKAVEQLVAQTGDEKPLRTIDKMPDNYPYVGYIKSLFPNAKVIECVRDPRDVCLSCLCTLFASPQLQLETSSLENVASLFKSYKAMMQHWRRTCPEYLHQVGYAELVSNPKSTIRDVLEFIDLPFEESCTAVAQNNETGIHTASIIQARQPIYKTSLQKWRKYEKELKPLTEMLAEEISEFESRYEVANA